MLLPVRGLAPLLSTLAQQTAAHAETDENVEEHWAKHVDWNPAYNHVKVPVSAQWTDLSVTARDLLKLKPGDIIPLDPNRLSQVEVQLAGHPKYTGRLGSLDQKAAVQINEHFKS